MLLYNRRVILPIDYKFQRQFSNAVTITTGTRKITKVALDRDDLFNAFKVFAIAQWRKKDFNLTPKMKKNISLGLMNK